MRLPLDRYATVQDLYSKAALCFPLILAVIQGRQRGLAFADRPDKPDAAVVISSAGFTCFLDSDDRQFSEFDHEFMELLRRPSEGVPSYLLWYSPPLRWREWLDRQATVRCRERVRLTFAGKLNDLPSGDCSLPSGWRLCGIDAQRLDEMQELGLDVVPKFWVSADDFLNQGVGRCLVDENDNIVSVCYSASVAGGQAEVDVLTREGYRGQGNALMVARAFLRACLSRGITPVWDCFSANTASLKLAYSLGFKEVVRYPFYSFNVPLAG